jgi:hypothetical protein
LSSVSLNFTVEGVNWGSGRVTSPFPFAYLNTLGVVENGNWSNVTQGFILENIGQTDVSLSLSSSSGGASSFIGGTDPEYYWNITNNETGSCNETLNLGEWYSANSSLSVCDIFYFNDSKDEIRIDINLTIPSDSNKGQLSDIITAIGTAI